MMNLSIYIYIYIFAATYITRGKLAAEVSAMDEESFGWGLTVLIVPKYHEIQAKNQ